MAVAEKDSRQEILAPGEMHPDCLQPTQLGCCMVHNIDPSTLVLNGQEIGYGGSGTDGSCQQRGTLAVRVAPNMSTFGIQKEKESTLTGDATEKEQESMT